MDLVSVRDILVAGAGLTTSIGAILFFIKQWIVSPINTTIDRRVTEGVRIGSEPVLDKLEKINILVRDIQHEVNYNNGQSLKDVVRKTREQLEDLANRFDECYPRTSTRTDQPSLLGDHDSSSRPPTG